MAIYGGMQPSEYYLRRDARKDDKFRDIINLFLTLSQNKRQKEQFGINKELQSRGLDIQERQVESLEGYRNRPPDPSAFVKDIEHLRTMYPGASDDELFRIYQEKGGPSVFQEKVAYGSDVLGMDPLATGIFAGGAEGRAPIKTSEQIYADSKARTEGAEAGKPLEVPTPGHEGGKGSPQRNAWIKTVDTFYKETDYTDDPKKYLTKTYGLDVTPETRPITPSGLYLDMPRKYNYAIFARDNKVASPEDLDIIRKYDDMFRLFSEVIFPRYATFKEFMKTSVSRDDDMDIRQMKDWYDIYAK